VSSLILIFIPATYLLPVVRFVGLIWMIATGLLLPRSRAESHKNKLRYLAGSRIDGGQLAGLKPTQMYRQGRPMEPKVG
jgi:hypothetical protein